MFGFRRVGECPTPANLQIVPRSIEIDLLSGFKKTPYWFDNDPVKTHFFNALQSSFPEGERLFIDAARDVMDECGEDIPDALKKQLKLFIRQEAMHGRHHEEWNEALVALGYSGIAAHSDELKRNRLLMKLRVPAKFRLAITAAGEHFTACTARLHLHDDRGFFESVERPFRDLLLYHALEEIEHKAVCYDLFEHAGGSYFLRVAGAFNFTMGLIYYVKRTHVYLLKKDGLWNKEARKKARKEIWGRKGLVIKLLPDILDYLRPGFHPWKNDDRTWLLKDFNENFKEYGIKPPVTV